MPGLSDDELAKYFDELTQATREGLIQWTSANPTTFVWDKLDPPRARLSLQQVSRRELVRGGDNRIHAKNIPYYVFQVFEMPAAGGLVTREEINGNENDAIDDKLEALFHLIRNEKLQKDLDFLRGTLPKRAN